MTAPGSASSLLTRAGEFTGFDAGRVAGAGDLVMFCGLPGVGVSSLISACRCVDDGLGLLERERPPGVAPARIGLAILVVDPSSSVGAEEQRLLAALRAAHGTVAVVCTKIDAFWEWPRLARAHRRTLDPYESLPVFGVSASAACAGAVEESGVGALVGWIREMLDESPQVRDARARLAASQGAVEHTLAVPAPDRTDAMSELMRRRRKAMEGRDRGRSDRLAVTRTGLSRVRAESCARLQTGLRTLSAASATGETTDAQVAQMRQSLTELAETVVAATDERIDEVRSVALLGLDADPDPTDAWRIDLDDVQPGPGRGSRSAEDVLMVVIGASTGLGAGRLIVAPMAAVQTLQWISMPLTLLLGVAVAGWVIRLRRRTADRAETSRRVAEMLVEARSRADHQIGLHISAVETRIAGQIARAYDRRARLAAVEVARLDDEIRGLRDADTDRRRRRDQARGLLRELAAAVSAEPEGAGGGRAASGTTAPDAAQTTDSGAR